jgi:phosphohistidine phosphatase SixA
MRHAEAPGGAGDPPGFRLDDSSTQRNLSAKGRADAQAVGKNLRAKGVAVARLLSSP